MAVQCENDLHRLAADDLGFAAQTVVLPFHIGKLLIALHDVAIGAARQPDVMKRFEEMGFDYVGSSPADGDKRLEAERDKWRDVIKRANIKVDL